MDLSPFSFFRSMKEELGALLVILGVMMGISAPYVGNFSTITGIFAIAFPIALMLTGVLLLHRSK